MSCQRLSGMDHEDSFEESQGSSKSSRGKRGVIWGNAETSALIKVWGEAEVRYALSSLKRNYEIFEMISTELCKLGFTRSAEECRTKTKSLRKLYKQAVINNNTSGSGRSKFIWFDEMAQIFRTDTSIHPLRTTESESAPTTGSMEDSGDVLFTLDLLECSELQLESGSGAVGAESLAKEQCEPSTSGCSSGSTTAASNSESARRSESHETTNYEATLDPAKRLAMLRKRKQRASAAARLDNTLTGFVNWVQRNTETSNTQRNEIDKTQQWFQKEIVTDLREASTSLRMLTEYLTSGSCDKKERGRKKQQTIATKNKTHISLSKLREIDMKGGALRANVPLPTDSSGTDSDSTGNNQSENEMASDLGENASQSLLQEVDIDADVGQSADLFHSTPQDDISVDMVPTKTDLKKLAACEPQKGQKANSDGQSDSSPYLIVKNESKNMCETLNLTPKKRLRKKKKIFSP